MSLVAAGRKTRQQAVISLRIIPHILNNMSRIMPCTCAHRANKMRFEHQENILKTKMNLISIFDPITRSVKDILFIGEDIRKPLDHLRITDPIVVKSHFYTSFTAAPSRSDSEYIGHVHNTHSAEISADCTRTRMIRIINFGCRPPDIL